MAGQGMAVVDLETRTAAASLTALGWAELGSWGALTLVCEDTLR